MNRADLSWALSAVLPHVGKTVTANTLGLTVRDGYAYVYSTDLYTLAVARAEYGGTAPSAVHMTAKEATELMRFVRPNKVAEQEQPVVFAYAPGELHIGWAVSDEENGDSGVFETVESDLTLDLIFDKIREIEAKPTDPSECILSPALLSKFAKAQREDIDRLRLVPKRIGDSPFGPVGAALVTIGTDFIAAIGGMSNDNLGVATVAAFLSTEGKAA